MLPEKIGHYTIVSELGRGGMGVVYKAREEALNRFVAIKVLTEQLTEDATFLQRFVREAQAAAALSHPNIVQIFFIGEDQGHPYFVMEYVTGRSLNHLLREEGRIDNPRASQMMLQAGHGLAAAHDQGIVHRDIKPANLILDERGIVKIADFGLALPADAETRLTASGMLVGTPGYLAPEQCRGEKVDNRTDIYALGVTFYLLLSGQAPFRGESPLALLRQILDEQPPDISTLNPNVDAETRRILQKMIAKDREQRYQNCHDLISDFEDYLAKAGVRSMTAGLASRKTAANDAAVAAAAAAAAAVAATAISTPAASAQHSAVTQRTLEPIAQAAAAPPPTSVHDTPTVHVSASNIEPPTQPPVPYQEPKTQPPTPMPVPVAPPPAAGAYAPPLTSTSSSSNARTLIILAAIVVALVAAALLLAKNFFPGKPQPPTIATTTTQSPATTTSPTSSAATTATTALLGNTVTTTISDGATSIPPATTTTLAANDTSAATPQTQQVAVTRAAAITPTTPASPTRIAQANPSARTTTPPPLVQSKPARGLSGVVFAVTGDQQLVGAVSTVVSAELSAASLDAVDAETMPSTEEMVRRGDVSVSRLLDKVRAEGRAVLLLVRVDPAGQRELSYMGRHDTAYSSRVTLTAYDVASGRAIGAPNKGTVEYTSATADRESEKVVGRLARASVEAIQNR